jgi:hypothetical protein
MRRHKTIYYIPGILTLAFAPLLFMARTNKYLADRTEHCIQIIAGVENDKRNIEILFPFRAYQTFKLTGNRGNDSINNILIENFARGLHDSKNDSIGLKVVLDRSMKYKAYINLLNSCLKAGISDWIPLGDTICIFQKNRPENYNNNLCQNSLTLDIHGGIDFITASAVKPKLTLFQIIRNEREQIRLAIPFSILFLLLGYQIMKNLRKES